MTTEKRDRLTMPGEPPTDEDLRTDAELTRQELAATVAALSEKADLKAQAHKKAEQLRERGDELVEKLPPPVATRVRPVMDVLTRNPALTAAGLVAALLVLRRLLKR
jgi:hypothetical protein